MANKQKVLLLGPTGETGTSVLNGLVEDGSFDVTLLVQPSSAEKPAVQALKAKGLRIVIGDLKGPVDQLVPLLQDVDTVISAIGALAQLDQIKLVDAAKIAGIKRFVPCGFTTISPRGGVMIIRDEKEIVHDRVFYHHLPYTIIDVGYWHDISFPPLPSGKVDYALARSSTDVYGTGETPNLLTDKRDIGRFVARAIKDPRTLNKRVVTHSDELSQNQIWEIMERLSGEKIPRTIVPIEQVVQLAETSGRALAQAPNDLPAKFTAFTTQYNHSKYVRADNTLQNAEYLGYLDARKLYPDFKPISFEQFVEELLAGKATRPYPHMKLTERGLEKKDGN